MTGLNCSRCYHLCNGSGRLACDALVSDPIQVPRNRLPQGAQGAGRSLVTSVLPCSTPPSLRSRDSSQSLFAISLDEENMPALMAVDRNLQMRFTVSFSQK